MFLLAALVTTVLSLDATVVLLTPVVLAAAASAGVSARPGAHACLRMANSASLLLPVSNLTNLRAMRAPLLAHLLTNLSATLLLVPMLAPLGTTAVLAALLGLTIGSGLTYRVSLANLLWRRTLLRHGRRPTLREFHRVSLVVTPSVCSEP